MFNHSRMRPLRLLLLGLVLTSQPSFSQDTQPLDSLVDALETEAPLGRIQARMTLKKHLETSAEKDRPALIQTLIDSLSSHNEQVRMGICNVLNSLNFFWVATNHEKSEKILYDLYLAETDADLKMVLDAALMRAKGSYSQMMEDLNNEKVDPSVEAGFKRIYEKYPLSKYAVRAKFFLGQYYIRTYAILKKQGQKPNLDEYVMKSNSVFQDFLVKIENIDPHHELVADARFFSAINWVMVNQVDKAIPQLKLIENTANDQEKIEISGFFTSDVKNVWAFFYNDKFPPPPDMVEPAKRVDRFLAANSLAKHVRQYLETHRTESFKEPANLAAFANHLYHFKPPMNTQTFEQMGPPILPK